GFQRLQGTSKNFLQSLVQIFQQRNFLKDLFAFFDIKVSKENQHAITFPEGKLGLSVKNISFTYPQTNKLVLNNVSLNCSPGKIIAIVGENGSGKSTLIKLLARLYKLESGTIDINKNQIKDIST